MPWNPTTIDSQILAIHGALVPSGNQGEVLLFGGDEHWSAQQEPGGNFRKTRVYDVGTHSLLTAPIPSPDSDVFCAGQAFVGDGRFLIVGGTKAWSTGHGHDLAFWAHRRCWIYNPRERTWVETAQLLPDPYGDGTSGGGRWYPGAVTMGNGEVLGLFGHIAQDDSRHRNASPERYNVNGNNWSQLPKLANDGANYEPNFGSLTVRFLFFTRTFQLPDGTLFFATPMPVEWASNTSSGVNPTDGTHFSSRYDPGTGDYTGHKIPEPAGYDSWSFPCVLLPLLPEEDYRPRALHCGRSQSMRIDLGVATPQWQGVATALGINRVNSCASLLPSGQVCLVGGVQNQSADGDEKPPAEIYDPNINWTTGQYNAGLGSWSADVAPNIPVNSRNYHSIALLLPNGSVLTAGGDKNAASDDPNVVGVKRIELYEPAYPAGTRPSISSAPAMVTYGESFRITMSANADNIRRVALMRNGSCTHAYDFDQRYVGLQFTHTAGTDFLTATAPPNGNVAPPGYYMLWVLDDAGRPCQLAKFVRLAHVGCRVITDRSTFSAEEVAAVGSGSFDNVIYAQFDGFIATELTGTPTFALEWEDNHAPVPLTDLTLASGGRLQEVTPGSLDIPQRITFPFHVRFLNNNTFSTFTDRRQIRLTFTLGHHRCSQTIDLTHSPNPYMIDINLPENNPSWLSTDVRVFSMLAGQPQFGDIFQGMGNPIPFIHQCLDKLNDPANNGNALFQGLSTSATLDLAGNGPFPMMLPIYNYAIARVRYRATTTTAQRVKCFFRMFNVAATGLEFDPNTTYHRTTVGPNTVPLVGTAGGEVASIPFFASNRVETVQGRSGADSMTTQTLAAYEIRDMVPASSGNEVTAFFGCWLDINETRKRIPLNLGGSDGPWPEASCRSIQELTRGRHMCIVGEVFFEPDLTQPGETPDASDNLSQRNLVILHSDNPGVAESHTVMHTFEIKPSLGITGKQLMAGAVNVAPGLGLAVGGKRVRLDELLFRWYNLPSDTEVTVYFSDIDTAEIQMLATLRRSPLACQVVDKHTLKFKVAGATWIPIPGGRSLNIPALLSIKLPNTVTYGQEYRVSIHQVAGNSGEIIGSFDVRIPVSKAELILDEEIRTLSVFKHILTTIPTVNRWYPLMQRYVHHMGLRVDALGGNADDVYPNTDGSGRPYEPPDRVGERKPCWEGWLTSIVLALTLLLIGLAPSTSSVLPVLVLGILLLVILISFWSRKCCGRNRCALLDHLILGGSVALALLVLISLAGIGGAFVGQAAFVAAVLTALFVIGSFVFRCRGKCCDDPEEDCGRDLRSARLMQSSLQPKRSVDPQRSND